MRLIKVFTLACCLSCGSEPVAEPESADEQSALKEAETLAPAERECEGKPIVLPRQVPVASKSQLRWTKEWWRWILSIPAVQNPELVLDVDCGLNQSGPVFYLPGFAADVYTRKCQVPFGKFVLAPVWSFLNDYPCPDPNFQPAPGQTLEQFLQAGAADFLGKIQNIKVTVDGHQVDYTKHRQTTGVFNFTGHPSLTKTFDGCITGTAQQAISDGWWLMLAPLSPGRHTVAVTGIAPSGKETSQTFELTVARP